MKTIALVLLDISPTKGWIIGSILFICAIGLFLIFKARHLRKKLVENMVFTHREGLEVGQEFIQDENVRSESGSQTEPAPGNYEVNEQDTNLFVNKKYPQFTIRLFPNHQRGDKDEMKVSLSTPHFMDPKKDDVLSDGEYLVKGIRAKMLSVSPSLQSVATPNAHDIILRKSGAANWEHITGAVLKFLFVHMHNTNGWQFEKQVVGISIVPNKHILVFHLRVETRYHLILGTRLLAIRGIVSSATDREHPLRMEYEGVYDFSLEKAPMYTWDELLPEIKKVFAEYFTAGVEFKNLPSKFSDVDFRRARPGNVDFKEEVIG